MLDNEPYAAVFGPESKAHYLAGTLEKKGELLLRYDAVAHEQLANGIALVSGQGPTAADGGELPDLRAVRDGRPGADGQVLGSGCVYPSSMQTVGGQLAAKHLKWRAYVEGIDEPGTAPAPARIRRSGAADGTLEAGPYATFRDPFVYFESVVSSPACALGGRRAERAEGRSGERVAHSEPLLHRPRPLPRRRADALLAGRRRRARRTPTGSSNRSSREITASKAYKEGGLIVITTDEAPSSGEYGDSSSCCGQPAYPNLAAVEGHGKGGGTVGALLLSPLRPRRQDERSNRTTTISLLRTIEDIFKLEPPRLRRRLRGVKPLGAGAVHCDRQGLSAARGAMRPLRPRARLQTPASSW